MSKIRHLLDYCAIKVEENCVRSSRVFYDIKKIKIC